eukprot:GFUD01025562.1.p1 GENE.GFUD01025562.1~~GFUD01025562.1.p1  ORF type:complete len:384 (+),score=111.63 GFUD01025562.1:49-1200(+)
MSQYRGYYTSAQQGLSQPPSVPFIANNDDDFEYDDTSYQNCNKRSYSELEIDPNYNHSLGSDKIAVKYQKMNNYNSSNSVYNSVSMHHSKVTTENIYTTNVWQSQPPTSHPTSSQPSVPHSTQITPELSMPVFQTADRCNQWEDILARAVTAGDDDITVRSEKSEQWAWGNGKKWVGASGPRPKLNIYSVAPNIEMFHAASRVSGGIGEKMLLKMGWSEGEGLGKRKEGDTEPIQFMEIKTDRRGLVTRDDDKQPNMEVQNVEEKTKSKFCEIKSTSFWNWHGTGMKGPENMKDRLKKCKKEVKDKEPLDLTGKHPVSAIMELCSKKRWAEPRFISETGSAGFKFRVEVNGASYTPSTSSDTKKSAKAESAKNCLVQMGLWSS